MNYGHAPEVIGTFDLDWDEYMHYMYLPIVMPDPTLNFRYPYRLPERLGFLEDLVLRARYQEMKHDSEYDYIYVTARRGFATPGNPLNRPGWHADGFGTDDVNYIWTDAFPTLFAVQEFVNISDDHCESIDQFTHQVERMRLHEAGFDGNIKTYPEKMLLRLDPFVVHQAPEIPAPGGERGFIKISFSNEKYNLKGNSHNYLFDYDWKMWSRDEIRNDPAYAGGDAGPQEVAA